eukprot:jgi/Galph1/2747/GphlegSOOS_G1421.1
MKNCYPLYYLPVQVSHLYEQNLSLENGTIGGLRLEPYRMNLVAMNKEGKLLYVAYGDRIFEFLYREKKRTVLRRELLAAPDVINTLKYAELTGVGAILVAACGNPVIETGAVVIYFMNRATANRIGQERVVLSMSSSVWGISICEDTGLIATSSNDHCISMIRILLDTQLESRNRVFLVPSICCGHEHNIPCIDFSKHGRYIASASIDETLRVWDLKTEDEGEKWGWGVKWLSIDSIKLVEDDDPLYSYFFNATEEALTQPLLTRSDEFNHRNLQTLRRRWSGMFLRSRNVHPSSVPEVLVDSQNVFSDEVSEGGLSVLFQDIGLSLNDMPTMDHEERDDKILVYTQRNFLHLLRAEDMYQLLFMPQVVPWNFSGSLMHRGMCRLNFLDYAPELSLLAVGNQGAGLVSLCRLLRNRSGQFCIFIEAILPDNRDNEQEEVPTAPLAGLFFKKGQLYSKYCPYYHLVLVHLTGKLQVYQIERRTESSALDISACFF